MLSFFHSYVFISVHQRKDRFFYCTRNVYNSPKIYYVVCMCELWITTSIKNHEISKIGSDYVYHWLIQCNWFNTYSFMTSVSKIFDIFALQLHCSPNTKKLKWAKELETVSSPIQQSSKSVSQCKDSEWALISPLNLSIFKWL